MNGPGGVTVYNSIALTHPALIVFQVVEQAAMMAAADKVCIIGHAAYFKSLVGIKMTACQVRRPPQRGLSSNTMALITSCCVAMRISEHHVALITSGCARQLLWKDCLDDLKS